MANWGQTAGERGQPEGSHFSAKKALGFDLSYAVCPDESGLSCRGWLTAQRGVNRCITFCNDADRETYLRLLGGNLDDAGVRLCGFCLMTNHVHLVAVPGRNDSFSVLFRRLHGRYAQYYNARTGRTGHLWQNRYFACPLGEDHLWTAMVYVERNPVRAGIVERAADYRWSSAVAHLTGQDATGMLDMEWWRRERPVDWEQLVNAASPESDRVFRRCTYAGRPFGSQEFVNELSERFGRYWIRGRPKKKRTQGAAQQDAAQFNLFDTCSAKE